MKFLVYGLSNGWGGVESIVMAMVSRLSAEHRFDLLMSEGTCTYEQQYMSPHIRFVHIPAWGNSRRGFRNGLMAVLQSHDYDYVWVNACLMSNRDIIEVVKRHSNAKVITHSHGSSFEEQNKVKRLVLMSLHFANRRYYARNVDFPCMCSHKSGLWFYGKQYMSQHNVYMIKNGVDVGKYKFDNDIRDKYRQELGLKDEIALFHAGRLTLVKNQQCLIDVVAELHKRGSDCRLFIAGDGELRSELESYAKSLQLEGRVRFLGNRNDVAQLYQAMDAFLLPSFHEGFPVTLAEAQATGLFCVASENVSSETNIGGQMQFLPIGKGDISAWADCIQTHKFDLCSRKDMGQTVVNQGYNIETVCKDFIQHITEQ